MLLSQALTDGGMEANGGVCPSCGLNNSQNNNEITMIQKFANDFNLSLNFGNSSNKKQTPD